jgi:hypothetical protein
MNFLPEDPIIGADDAVMGSGKGNKRVIHMAFQRENRISLEDLYHDIPGFSVFSL